MAVLSISLAGADVAIGLMFADPVAATVLSVSDAAVEVADPSAAAGKYTQFSWMYAPFSAPYGSGMVPVEPELLNAFAATKVEGEPRNGVYVAPELSEATKFVQAVGHPSEHAEPAVATLKNHNSIAPTDGTDSDPTFTVPPVALFVGIVMAVATLAAVGLVVALAPRTVNSAKLEYDDEAGVGYWIYVFVSPAISRR